MKQRVSHLITAAAVLVFGAAGVATQGSGRSLHAIVLDNSGSLRTEASYAKSLANAVWESISRQGEVCLVHFEAGGTATSARPVVGLTWTQDPEKLYSHVKGIETVSGQTTLIDAIALAAEKLIERKDQDTEKTIILISDGEDRTSQMKPENLFEFLRVNNVKVYAVGLVCNLNRDCGFVWASAFRRARKFLEGLTKSTGGHVVFPTEKEKVADTLKKLLSPELTNKK